MSEILFENKNAVIEKEIKVNDCCEEKYIYLKILDENGRAKNCIPLKKPQKDKNDK